jgi:hypothetical protein
MTMTYIGCHISVSAIRHDKSAESFLDFRIKWIEELVSLLPIPNYYSFFRALSHRLFLGTLPFL